MQRPPSNAASTFPNVEESDHMIRPHKNDVLNGRGVSIAKHPGNLRFRSLITTYLDENYCFSYTAVEKKAIATEIIQHISKLNPPGRFLTRASTDRKSKGLGGTWYLMDEKETLKKTCQALRDCNRTDRSGYAKGVKDPEDVKHLKKQVKKDGLSVKDLARVAVEGKRRQDQDTSITAKVTATKTTNKGQSSKSTSPRKTKAQQPELRQMSRGHAPASTTVSSGTRTTRHLNPKDNLPPRHHDEDYGYTFHRNSNPTKNRVHDNDRHPSSLDAPNSMALRSPNFHPPQGNLSHHTYHPQPTIYKDNYLPTHSYHAHQPYIPFHSKFSPMLTNREPPLMLTRHPAAGNKPVSFNYIATMEHNRHEYFFHPPSTAESLHTTFKEDPLAAQSTNISKSTSTSSPMTPVAHHTDDPCPLNTVMTGENHLDQVFDSNELEDILDFETLDDADFLFELYEREVS